MASKIHDSVEGSVQGDGETTGAAVTSDKETAGSETESTSITGTGIQPVTGPPSP
jgi:hypothetical protein